MINLEWSRFLCVVCPAGEIVYCCCPEHRHSPLSVNCNQLDLLLHRQRAGALLVPVHSHFHRMRVGIIADIWCRSRVLNAEVSCTSKSIKSRWITIAGEPLCWKLKLVFHPQFEILPLFLAWRRNLLMGFSKNDMFVWKETPFHELLERSVHESGVLTAVKR